MSGDSWMYPYQRNISLYSGCLWVIIPKNPYISISTMGTLLGVHPIVPWTMVINHLLTGRILQVHSQKLTNSHPKWWALEHVTFGFKNMSSFWVSIWNFWVGGYIWEDESDIHLQMMIQNTCWVNVFFEVDSTHQLPWRSSRFFIAR